MATSEPGFKLNETQIIRNTPSGQRLTPLRFGLVLGLLALIALALRFYGINWDQGYMFHPDERAILMRVVGLEMIWPPDLGRLWSVDSPLNPKWFPYGSFPLYLVKFVGHIASIFDPRWAGLDNLRYIGRGISSFADVGTIILIALIGRRLYRPAVGLLAAAFATFAVLAIQQSHFFVVDVVLVFFMTLTVYCSARVMAGGGWKWTVFSGIAFGLAVASKVSVAPFGLVLLLAHLLRTVPGDARSAVQLGDLRLTALGPALLATVAAGIIAVATFTIVAPYSFIDWKTFSDNIIEQSEMVRRIRDYPYTRQYVDVPKVLYEIRQLTVWGLGLPLGIAGWLALFLTTLYAIPGRRKADLLILTAVWPYFLLSASFQVKFLRYLLPLVPFLSLLAARWLVAWHAWWVGQRTWRAVLKQSVWRAVPAALTALVLAMTAFYALAFANMYSSPHPATAMSHWIRTNVPPGTLIVKEHWEEGIPDLPGYRIEELQLYDPDSPAKIEQIVQRLTDAGYIVFYSNRLYGTIPRLSERYPVSTDYYRDLFNGSLGYELVHYETSYPNLFGIAFVDDTFGRPGLPVPDPLRNARPAPVALNLGYADESFTVYDHPKVMIFGKTGEYSPAVVRAELQSALSLAQSTGPTATAPEARSGTGLMMTPEMTQIQRAGGTWSDLFDPDSPANRLPLLTWLLFIEAVGLLGLPAMLLLFRRLPDRGYLLGKCLSLLLVVYLVWLGASLRAFPFSQVTILLAALFLGWVSLVVGWPNRHRLIEMARANGRVWLIGEAVFLGAFLLFYFIRLANPDLWHPARGGEKPMDFAYLNAVIKSTYFPPYDPWFADGYLNYYYFGQVIVATATKVTGIVPAVAYNLAVPLLFAYFVGNVFSVGYNLLAGRRPSWRLRSGWVVGGLVTVLFVALFGNLDGWAQIFDGLTRAGTMTFDSALPGVTGVVRGLEGLGRILGGQAQMSAFDFWRSSRMMPPTPNITEFPYFTFLFADLHAHLIGLPFTVLALGLGLTYVRTMQARPENGPRQWLTDRLSGIAVLLALAVVLGALRAINSWDYPTYLLLCGWSLVVAELARRRGLSWAAFVWIPLGALILYLAAHVFFLPFINNYELFYTGVQPSAEKTPLHQYLGVYGLFLFATLSLLAVEARRQFGESALVRSAFVLGRNWPRLPHALALYRRLVSGADNWLSLLAGGLLAAIFVFAVVSLVMAPLVAILLVLFAVLVAVMIGEIVHRRGDWPLRLFVWGVMGLALGLGIGVDLVTIQGDIGRMNTVFKFYLQAWVLWGIAAAFSLALLLPGVLRRVAGPGPVRASLLLLPVLGVLAPSRPLPAGAAMRRVARPNWRPWETAWLIALALLIAGSAIYPLGATPVRLADRFQALPPTLDGMAFMKVAEFRDENRPIDIAADEAGIRWMQENVQGSPVIAEAVTPLYRWGSRVSVYTGLPTIVGWDWHQKQQRWGYQQQVEARLNDVRTLFTTPDPRAALEILRKYDVRYVYVGPVERVYYPAAGLAKFDQMVGSGLSVAFETPEVTIYEVEPAR